MTLRLARKAPLGHRADGTPFWIYSGSAPDEDGNDNGGQDGDGGGDEDDDSDDSDEDDDAIGEDGLTGKGRRAIEAERKSAKVARDRYKPFSALMRKHGVKTAAELEALIKGKTSGGKSSDDDGPSADEIREEARREASQKANDRLVRAGVKTVAAELLNDSKDALAFLDLSDYEVDENGDIDEAQVKRDLKALLADKPYLGKAKKGDGRSGGAPNFDGGTRKTRKGSGMNELIRRSAGIR